MTSVMFFWLMAEFSEDYPVVARWLIVVPAALLACLSFTALLLANIKNAGDVIALGLAIAYFALVFVVALRQLKELKRGH